MCQGAVQVDMGPMAHKMSGLSRCPGAQRASMAGSPDEVAWVGKVDPLDLGSVQVNTKVFVVPEPGDNGIDSVVPVDPLCYTARVIVT